MNVQYSPEARQSAKDTKLLGQASLLLADILGPKASQIEKAEWSREQDRQGRTLYRLTVGDYSGEVFMDFEPDDFQNSRYMRISIHRLWGDLLQVRNDIQHEKVLISSSQLAASSEED